MPQEKTQKRGIKDGKPLWVVLRAKNTKEVK
jgi:hypothetical protein